MLLKEFGDPLKILFRGLATLWESTTGPFRTFLSIPLKRTVLINLPEKSKKHTEKSKNHQGLLSYDALSNCTTFL
jgi:hypothetical protein